MQLADLLEELKIKSDIVNEEDLSTPVTSSIPTTSGSHVYQNITEFPEKGIKEREEEYLAYLNMKDPSTGKPFAIPLLDYTDPEYSSKYVDLMKMREYNPQGFKKIMEWN